MRRSWRSRCRRRATASAALLRFRTNVDDWVTCDAAHRLRFEAAADGGLTPYLHVRADLWAKVTRALYYDLVDMGEERMVDGREMFGVASAGEFFAMADAEQVRDATLNEPMLKSRARRDQFGGVFRSGPRAAALRRSAGLTDASIVPPSGDPGTDRMLEIIAQRTAGPARGGADRGRRSRRSRPCC